MSRRMTLFSTILDRRDEDPLVVGALRRRAEAARGDAADIVLVKAVRDPAEQLALPEHRTDEHHVLLVGGADPGVVREEHVAVADPRVVASMLQDPLHLGVGHAGHVLHVGAEVHELRVLGEDGRVEVERVDRDRRSRHFLDRGAVLLVHVPQVVADDLEGHRVHVLGPVPVELQGPGDSKLLRRHIRIVLAVEPDIAHFADSQHARFHPLSPVHAG